MVMMMMMTSLRRASEYATYNSTSLPPPPPPSPQKKPKQQQQQKTKQNKAKKPQRQGLKPSPQNWRQVSSQGHETGATAPPITSVCRLLQPCQWITPPAPVGETCAIHPLIALLTRWQWRSGWLDSRGAKRLSPHCVQLLVQGISVNPSSAPMWQQRQAYKDWPGPRELF